MRTELVVLGSGLLLALVGCGDSSSGEADPDDTSDHGCQASCQSAAAAGCDNRNTDIGPWYAGGCVGQCACVDNCIGSARFPQCMAEFEAWTQCQAALPPSAWECDSAGIAVTDQCDAQDAALLACVD